MKGIKKIHIIFLLLTLDLLSCTGSKKENAYKAAVKQSNVSNLKFDNDYYDFGDISLGQKVFHDFYFINNSKIPLILYDVSSSCGCTVPTWPKKSVLPGHKNYIRIVYQSISDPGTHLKLAIVKGNIPGDYHVLKIRAKVKPNKF